MMPPTGSTGVYGLTYIKAINKNRERGFYEQIGILTLPRVLFILDTLVAILQERVENI